MKITTFTFNPFAENTYVLEDENGECCIVDPGMVDEIEDSELFQYISSQGLRVKFLLNTHCHIDHILGNASVKSTYGVGLWTSEKELLMLDRGPSASLMWNIPYRLSPQPDRFINEGNTIEFGSTKLDILFVPGHSPGHLAFVHHRDKTIIGGDVLFKGSIGRTDLPGCNLADLISSIRDKFYTLSDDYIVYPGHGEPTTIGDEKLHNPFVRG
jgi:hydroxyacylglutathione hydrolase